MKKQTVTINIFINLFIFLGFSLTVKAGLNDYSMGYRLGVLSKCSTPGSTWTGGLTDSLECEMYLGKESSNSYYGGPKNDQYKNPWAFSGDTDSYDKVSKFLGLPVVIKYKELRNKTIGGAWANNTDYLVVDVLKLQPQIQMKQMMEVKNKTVLDYSHGARFGRIVKISEKGSLMRTSIGRKMEVILQLGSGGSNFFLMSLDSPEMFDYCLKLIKSGQTALFYYYQSSMNLNDTNYIIYKIKLIPDPWKAIELVNRT